MGQTAIDPTPGARLYPWLDRAWSELGVAVSQSPTADARIHGYFADAGHPEVSSNATAWCAAFVGACLERSGIVSTRSLLARSYLSYGTSLSKAVPGAIAVFSRGSDPSIGHVGFVVGETDTSLIILGGNQSHAVSIIVMPRAVLLGLRWPSAITPSPATKVPTTPAAAPITRDSEPDPVFDRAFAHVLHMEGGYTDDPYDPGGPTNLGLTMADIATARAIPNTPDNAQVLKAAVVALTPADARGVYKDLYWQPSRASLLPAPLGFFHFDTAVNHGLTSAARMLQQALGVDIDGEIGPQTLSAATAADPRQILSAYADIRRERYRSLPTFWRFGRGWLARVDATQAAAAQLDGTDPSYLPPPTQLRRLPCRRRPPLLPPFPRHSHNRSLRIRPARSLAPNGGAVPLLSGAVS